MLGLLFSTISIGEVFTVNDSLQLVAVAVIGGVGSVAGPILGALWVVGLPAFWPSSLLVPLFTSSIGLLLLLMFCPGGLVQVGYMIRDALFAWIDRRLPETVEAPAPKPTAMPRARVERDAAEVVGDVLTTVGVSVRFGGRVAVDDVAIRVGAREVVGLVGTNGAGKTTLMNAVGGFLPSGGRVELLGHDITGLSPERRARRGLGRTFQSARLFGDLTVRETLQVALEARHRTGFVSTALFLPRGFRVDRRQRAEADEIIAFLGLGRYADRFCAELSTGTRRIVELGALLALDRARPVSRRAHGRRRATRDRGVRAAAATYPCRARRLPHRHRTRHADDHVDQRPGVLLGSGPRHRRRHPGRGSRAPGCGCVVPRHRPTRHRTQRRETSDAKRSDAKRTDGARTDADQLSPVRSAGLARGAGSQLLPQIDLADLAGGGPREVGDHA